MKGREFRNVRESKFKTLRADYLNDVKLRPWFKATNKPLHLFTSGLFTRNKCCGSLGYMPT